MALGFAGLLPQAAAVAVIVLGRMHGDAPVGAAIAVALIYPALILSFLGGIWWGIAMRRGAGQARLAGMAVLPSLFALACVGLAGAAHRFDRPLVLLGIAVLLTLLVDRHLSKRGEAPAGWMRLRVPLSLGLGGLTILAGVLIGGPIVRY